MRSLEFHDKEKSQPTLSGKRAASSLRQRFSIQPSHQLAIAILACIPLSVQTLAANHALLIAINDYSESRLQSLEGAHNDVALIREVLTNRFDFPPENVRSVFDQDATHSGLRDEFANLAERISADDIVYIHYSGHGSITPDLNGDERSGYDQTWVSFGSRAAEAGSEDWNIDRFDILDDEIDAWLSAIHEKTEHVIFVSDSCHSASVTRGDAPAVRGVIPDSRRHPLGSLTPSRSDGRAVRIGAAGDLQSAAEFETEDGHPYGLFSWYWAQAMYKASPGTTWSDLFQRAATQVQIRRGDSQLPQMEGNRTLSVFNDLFEPRRRRVSVTQVRSAGNRVWLDGGRLEGLTPGSLFAATSGDPIDSPAHIRISRVLDLESEAVVLSGAVVVGDRFEELTHAYPFEPIPVYIAGDFPNGKDSDLVDRIVVAVGSLPAYRTIPNQSQSELILYVSRSRKAENGNPVFGSTADTLPIADASEAPELWVMSPVEELLHDGLRIPFDPEDEGIDLLRKSLEKYSRARELKLLENSGSSNLSVAIEANILSPVADCNESDSCVKIPAIGNYRIGRNRNIPDVEFREIELWKGQILTYSLINRSQRDLYTYLLSISPSRAISVLFPGPAERTEAALLAPAERLDTFSLGYGHLLEESGEEVLKLIVSQAPIDVALLEQAGFARAASGNSSPLVRLLTNAMAGTRGSVQVANDSWSTKQISLFVK